jgi:hypothetical protein
MQVSAQQSGENKREKNITYVKHTFYVIQLLPDTENEQRLF